LVSPAALPLPPAGSSNSNRHYRTGRTRMHFYRQVGGLHIRYFPGGPELGGHWPVLRTNEDSRLGLKLFMLCSCLTGERK